jgi:hypothetical protein
MLRKITTFFAFVASFLAPIQTQAQVADSANLGPMQDLLANFIVIIDDVFIPFIIAIGFLVFVWGMFRFFILGGADEESKAKGKSLLINAIIGFVMIIIFWGVINLIVGSTGLEGETIENIPTVIFP